MTSTYKSKIKKYSPIQTTSLNQTRTLYTIPSVSEIAPLPKSKSHSI